jgi:hypothetical protein
MRYILSHSGKRVRQTLAIGGILLFSVLAQCGKTEEPPQPQAEEPKSLVEQYQEASKATAQNPGLAGSPGQLKEEGQDK